MEPLTGEVFRMPHETELWDTHVLFYRHRIFLQHVSRMENGERSCSIDLLIELSCILHVSTDYLLMGSEPSKEEVKNDLLSIISELSTIAKKI